MNGFLFAFNGDEKKSMVMFLAKRKRASFIAFFLAVFFPTSHFPLCDVLCMDFEFQRFYEA